MSGYFDDMFHAPTPAPSWLRAEEPEDDARIVKLIGPGDPFGLGATFHVCLTCAALVAEPMAAAHVAYHDREGAEVVTWGAVMAEVRRQQRASEGQPEGNDE